MRQRHLEQNVLVLVTLGLLAFGLVMVYSATSASAALGNGEPIYYLKKQSAYALVGLTLLVIASRLSYKSLRAFAPTLIAATVVLLVAVLALGETTNGARRWLRVGSATFQPSELAKLALVVWISVYLSRRPVPRTLGELVKPIGAVVAVFGALVIAEPDLGTAITICLIVGGMLLVAGAPLRLIGVAGALASVCVVAAIWLEPYRRTRIFSFLNPWDDAQGAGFQTVQAMIGLGSGGIFGVGLGEGVQKVFYLPEAHTDMIFAIIGEELGLVGTALIACAFTAFAWAGMRVARRCRDPFGKTVAAGITLMVCAQASLNLAAVVGLAPLTGVPLPLVSYGGSSLVVILAGVGILLNIGRNASARAAVVPDRSRRDVRAPRTGAGRGRGASQPRRERQLRRLA